MKTKKQLYAILAGLKPFCYGIHTHKAGFETRGRTYFRIYEIRLLCGGFEEDTYAETIWRLHYGSKRWGEKGRYYSYLLANGKKKKGEKQPALDKRIEKLERKYNRWLTEWIERDRRERTAREVL